MLFERLAIENYGVYEGRSEFDLTTTPEKPIVLVGGLNGAGKTTIFESIMIALYGRAYMGRKASRREYTAFIADKIHRHEGRRAGRASVEVAFRFHHDGSEDLYSVSRLWHVEGASVEETLRVSKNGDPMTDVDESLWQSFIEGLIPLGTARLFFFDGEKVVRITEWDKHQNRELKASIETLLGADLIRRLQSDLVLYTVRKSGTGKDGGSVREKYEEMGRERDALADSIEILEAEREKKALKLDEVAEQIKAAELEIAGSGGGYADMRSGLLAEKAVQQDVVKRLAREIHEGLAGDTPLYLVPKLLSEVEERMEQDTRITEQKAASAAIGKKVADIKREIKTSKFWPAGSKPDGAIRRISSRLDSLVQSPDESEFFDMSPNEAELVRQKAATVREGPHTLLETLKSYSEAASKADKATESLARIPKDDEIGPKITRVNELHREAGMIEFEVAHMDQQISTKNAHKKILQSKIRDLIQTLHGAKTAAAGVDLASKMCGALDTYYDKLSGQKLRELESHLLDTANSLLHKNMLSRINIDRETFEITVYGNDGEPITGGLLSMGEKQIIGTAMMWAIARTTGRSLPFVIDTPMGRLDGPHLVNLTDTFYPSASHQTILLSTDREIGRREYERLSECVSNSYTITCDPARSATTVARGYFAEEEEENNA